MSEHRVSETKLAEQQALASEAIRAKHSSGRLVWKIVAGTVVALLATGLITSLHDIRRYIRISTM